MNHSYHILPEKYCVVNTISGPLTFPEYEQLMSAILNDELFVPGMHMLWDFREGSLTQMNYDYFSAMAKYVESIREARGRDYKVVFLVKTEVDYGQSRMYQALSDKLPVELRVFYDETEAYEWIYDERGKLRTDRRK